MHSFEHLAWDVLFSLYDPILSVAIAVVVTIDVRLKFQFIAQNTNILLVESQE